LEGLLHHLQGGGRGSSGGGDGGKKDILYGKGFEMMAKFGGGEAEWHEWSVDFRTMVQKRDDGRGDELREGGGEVREGCFELGGSAERD
jgi:hypothetical protein